MCLYVHSMMEVLTAIVDQKDLQRALHLLVTGHKLWKTLRLTVTRIFRPRSWEEYLRVSALDAIVAIMCISSLVMSMLYSEEHFDHRVHPGFFHGESLLGLTVTILWLRQLKALQVLSLTGAFIYMIGQLMRDVFKWTIIFAVGLLGFSAGLSVLYRNQIMDSGFLYRPPTETAFDAYEECAPLDIRIRSPFKMMITLLEITLDGAGYWHCFLNSSTPIAGTLLYVAFTVFMTVVLLNALIAMMSETYSQNNAASFKNYVYAFASQLLEWDAADRRPVPLNLLALPYAVAMGLPIFLSTIYLEACAPAPLNNVLYCELS
jgi:hypothetical protein